MNDSVRINEFKAAVEFGFSPDLLRWFTQNPVIDNEVLPYIEEFGVYFFLRHDLESLHGKMLSKWPLPPKGSRPTIPAGIQREIKEEAQFSCPVCHRPQGELAHIHAVAKSYCNHPFNLLFLCPNHHTEYDYGHIYSNVTLDDVKAFKESLQRFNKIQWALKGNLINTYLGALNAAKSLLEVHDKISHSIEDAKYCEVLKTVATSIEERKKIKGKPAITIKEIDLEIIEFKAAHSRDLCPLCNGNGSTVIYHPCPICLGDGVAPENDPRLSHLEDYEPVSCTLCGGTGSIHGDPCPACGGDGQVSRGWADRHDWSQYET